MLMLLASASVGGYWWWTQRDSKVSDANIILHTVGRDDFVLAVTERGEIESAGVTEIRSEVKTKNTAGVAILDIVDEGTEVAEGDFLVELDASALEEERTTQQINVNAAEALVVEAHNVYETALIAKQEYLEGTFVQEKQTIESEIFVAEENLNRAKEYYEYSKRLAAKGYVNQLQLEADKFAVEKSQKELDAAKTKLRVLEQFTKTKMMKQLESDIKIFSAKWEANKNSYKLEVDKLQEIDDQIAKCTIRAPRAGTVIFAHERDRRGNEDFIVQEGAIVRERQVLIRLPDPGNMRVAVKVNESLVRYVAPGMPAAITPVGLGNRVLRGTVESVSQYAEPSSWRKPNIKEYTAYVSIDDTETALRSGMTASVTIECDEVRDAMQVPVQSVYAHGDQYYCFVYGNGEWEARPVDCGPTNDKFFVVEAGLDEQERVALNPRRYLDRVTLPDLPRETTQQAVRRETRAPEDAVVAESTSGDGESGESPRAGG